MHNSVNIPKASALYTLNEWAIWDINCISIKLFKKMGGENRLKTTIKNHVSTIS